MPGAEEEEEQEVSLERGILLGKEGSKKKVLTLTHSILDIPIIPTAERHYDYYFILVWTGNCIDDEAAYIKIPTLFHQRTRRNLFASISLITQHSSRRTSCSDRISSFPLLVCKHLRTAHMCVCVWPRRVSGKLNLLWSRKKFSKGYICASSINC